MLRLIETFLCRVLVPFWRIDVTSVTYISVSPALHRSCTDDALHVARARSIHELERRRDLHSRHCYHRNKSDFRSNRDDHRGAMARDVGVGRF